MDLDRLAAGGLCVLDCFSHCDFKNRACSTHHCRRIALPRMDGTGAGAVIALSGQTDVQPGTLTINGNLTFNSDSAYSYSYSAKANRARTGLVVANGVTINTGATVDFNGTIHGRLTPGLVLTVISNTSANPVSSAFSNLPDGSTVVLAGNTFQVNYEGGDGNDLTLTVIP